jgi:hypothetical protein
VFTIPDASPDSSFLTCETADISAGIYASDIPPAATKEAGSTCVAKLPLVEGVATNISIATASRPRPATKVRFTPRRRITLEDTPIIRTIIAAVIGKRASPLSNAPYPCTCCK